MTNNRPGNGIEESGPATARLELVRGLVERSLATGTGIDTFRRIMRVVFTGEGRFGSLLAENAELLYKGRLLILKSIIMMGCICTP